MQANYLEILLFCQSRSFGRRVWKNLNCVSGPHVAAGRPGGADAQHAQLLLRRCYIKYFHSFSATTQTDIRAALFFWNVDLESGRPVSFDLFKLAVSRAEHTGS